MLAGIDVGKCNLDVSIGGDRSIGFRNTAEGHERLIAALGDAGVTRVVCEPTGGYERSLVRSLRIAQFKVQITQ